jgi:hypothetical protein
MTYHNDTACTVSTAGGTHDAHDIADNGAVLHGATVPKDAS